MGFLCSTRQFSGKILSRMFKNIKKYSFWGEWGIISWNGDGTLPPPPQIVIKKLKTNKIFIVTTICLLVILSLIILLFLWLRIFLFRLGRRSWLYFSYFSIKKKLLFKLIYIFVIVTSPIIDNLLIDDYFYRDVKVYNVEITNLMTGNNMYHIILFG